MKHAGVYIHIPFCRSRCSYCDFATGMYESALTEKYVGAVAKEIREWNEVEPEDVDTIYFGGGTPSLLSPNQVQQILDAVHYSFNVIGGAEVTLEMNPGPELWSKKLRELRHLGVNRASFGAQTFDDDQLRRLGRTHTSDDIRNTFGHLREAGFDNINFDLIAGLPGQTLDGWARNLDVALALRPEHLSLYLLDIHEGTPLADQIRRGMHPTPDITRSRTFACRASSRVTTPNTGPALLTMALVVRRILTTADFAAGPTNAMLRAIRSHWRAIVLPSSKERS